MQPLPFSLNQIIRKRPKSPFVFIALLAFSVTLIACSGGGGGSGGSSPGASYTGTTDQALITSENSGTLIDASFQGAMTSDTIVPFSAAATGTQKGDPPPMPVVLQAAFTDSLADIVTTSGGVDAAQRAAALSSPMASSTNTLDGDCGGTASYTISYDESSGAFSGSLSYNGYCAGGVTLSGQTTFSGRLDPDSDSFDYFSFTFSNLTTTANGLSSTVNGTLECDFQGSDLLITTDMVIAQTESEQVCWLNNYTVQISGSQMEISGRYYDPVHGYIDFITVEPLTIYSGDQHPSAGLMEFTGAVGSGGSPTKARLRAVSTTTCQVTADLDGDGTFEYNSGEILWTDL